MGMGMGVNDFWDMTPHVLEVFMSGYAKRMERQRDYDNYIAYIQGAYFRDALASTIGNMFKKKSAKPIEYPSKPYEFSNSEPRDLPEEEKEVQRLAFLENLKTMQMNFEIYNKNKEQHQ